jgi:hypothetical protein
VFDPISAMVHCRGHSPRCEVSLVLFLVYVLSLCYGVCSHSNEISILAGLEFVKQVPRVHVTVSTKKDSRDREEV